jgi:hypothetical protein
MDYSTEMEVERVYVATNEGDEIYGEEGKNSKCIYNVCASL